MGDAERLGVFGGTFDPPHIGHIAAAVNARHALGLQRVLMVPAAVPWQKAASRAISSPSVRLDLARAAFEGIPGLEVSTVELDRGGESYSAETLEVLRATSPAPLLFLVVGSDLAATLDTWSRPAALRALATTVVYDRPGTAGASPPPGWAHERVQVPQLDVSSTDIRARVRDGRPIDGLVPPEVARLIAQHGLYRDAATVVRS